MQINQKPTEIQSNLGQIQKIEISKIKKYKKNNKIHTSKQIDQIRKSIVDFGYQQPIVLDKNNEIIIGHGRFEAIKQLKEMGSRGNDIDCIVAKDLNEKQVRKLRLLDNKTSDMAEWDFEAIKFELGELDDFELNDVFGDLDVGEVDPDIDFDNIEGNQDREQKKEETNVSCPDCGHTFTM